MNKPFHIPHSESSGVATFAEGGSAKASLQLSALIALLASIPPLHLAFAQGYPSRPIHMLVGSGAGGGADLIARMVAQKLSGHLGQSIVVENRAGGTGSVAIERLLKSPADGYTLLMTVASDTVQPAMRADLSYDLERDLAPVSLLATGAFLLLVHPSVPARSVKQLIALARVQPNKLSYGASGAGSTPHLAGELFKLMAQVNIVSVLYKSSAESTLAIASGQIDMGFPSVAAAMPLIDAGKVRPLAVTSMKRASFMPSIPTLDESGLSGYDRSGWYGVSARLGVPMDIIARLNTVIGKAVNTPEMNEAFNKLGFEPQTNTPTQFAAHIRAEIAQNGKLVKLARVKAE